MKTEEFRKRVRKIIKTNDPLKDDILALLKLTAHIDFGCEFINNECKTVRNEKHWLNDNNKWISKRRKMCCCAYCDRNIGYLRYIFEEDVETYAKLYNKDTGFWRENSGCVLPRELRSVTCATYVCSYNDYNARGLYDGMRVIRNHLDNLWEKLWEKYYYGR